MKTDAKKMEAVLNNTLNQLVILQSIVKLAAFAAEARETLNGIDDLKRTSPELCAKLDQHLPTGNDWINHDDVVGSVLRNVAEKMDQIFDDIGGVV